MRTRARTGATLNEGPVAMGGTPSADSSHTGASFLSLFVEDQSRAVDADPVTTAVRRSLLSSVGSPSATVGASAGGYQCPALRASRLSHDAVSETVAGAMPVSEPWNGPAPFVGVSHPPVQQPRVFASIASGSPPRSNAGSDRFTVALRRMQDPSFAANVVDQDGADRSQTASPSSMPPLEQAEDSLSSFEGSSLTDSPATYPAIAPSQDEPENGSIPDSTTAGVDGEERAAVVDSVPSSNAAPAQPPAQPPAQRHSSRRAARLASARISAAIATNGMVDMDLVTAPDETSSAAYALEDDVAEEVACPEAASSSNNTRTRSRRKAGPKTTGESPPAPMATRRSGRKRHSPTANLKEDSEEGLKSEDDDKKKPAEQHSCCICLDVPDKYDLSKLNGCEHLYCFGCIEKWADRENTCPQCKARFTKIERVNKAPPTKQRKKSDGGSGRVKNTKRVKNRDQRADIHHGNPLQGLFATMEANGTMPQSIAQLIFSGLGGINGGLMSSNRAGNGSAAGRTSQRSVRFGSTGSGHHSTEPYPLQPVAMPLSTMVRRLTRQDGPAGAGAASASSHTQPHIVSFRLSEPPVSSVPRSGTVVQLPDPWSGAPSIPSYQPPQGLATAAAHAAHAAVFPHDVDHESDEDDYGSFVQRVQHLSRERSAALERYSIGGGGGGRSAARGAAAGSVGAFGGLAAAGNTAETALEIDDDSDDEVIEVIEVPHE